MNKCQQQNDWLSWKSPLEDESLAAVVDVSSSVVTCNRRNKIGAGEQLGFIPLIEGKGCDLNLSVCILMLRVAQL